ncbi:bifunctional 2',3'-cyclic-nucleotide 2'-phosphodiesterase/3'-nucleotidase [Roseovarius spongiae]|uniref:Bifunctional 2',3'-cyclic-nucleotide 2'-phosphodiesterase/3'-nucleotidase n=1 Tax=Roseovarius spongiae TaxID=2320272 RepID=A0A3A8ASU6_9RHOB|nr:bifunctional 2',3'-cyclic-nucleotide 2'-phosphodiesterase/3'-nucleotidase [Roseovarius spongiae]RKF14599.1 bifunctional 2',3'-cyclic-nucleotide 2'-phosphodiesterase/3'-nucleotidase [Roseovarius spongiae]
MSSHDPSFDTAQAADTDSGAAIHLRLLSTTDLHGNLLPFDYFTDRGDQPYGLARTATLIRAARDEAANVMLFDNGDALQGTPLADITAQPGSGWTGAHPVIAAMNHLEYDAACVGNHEFNFGLDWLLRTLRAARHPVTCGNIRDADGGAPLPPYLLLKREMSDSDGRRHTLTIGVLGLVPPQIAVWDAPHLMGRLGVEDMVAAARRLIPQMRAEGADIVVVLGHTGIDAAAPRPGMENAALALAALPGVDALICGHSHEVFPDGGGGALVGTPTVMAGFRGSHLGVLDLTLGRGPGGWRVTAHASETRAVAAPAPVPADPALSATLARAHAATRAITARPIGRSAHPLHSYLAMARSCQAVRLVARAQRAALARAVAGTQWEGVPILSASPPFKTGGRGGPTHFTDIPPGSLSLRNAADLTGGFPNTLWGLRVSGAELRDWLERAATCFATLTPGVRDQPLCDPATPGHMFDLIEGLRYRIDLSAPPRFTPSGELIDPKARRIRDLTFGGEPLHDDAVFLLATTNYRASGAGPYIPPAPENVIHRGDAVMRDLLTDYLGDAGAAAAPDPEPVWRFAPLPGATAVLETGPDIVRIPGALEEAGLTPLGLTDAGFLRLRVPF